AKRRWLVVMDEQSSVPAAVPCLLQTLERQPARLSIAELSSDQLALGIEAVNDDVVKEVVRLAGSEDDLQHQNHRPLAAQLRLDERRRASDQLGVEALLPCCQQHVDCHDPAARLG